MAAYVCRCEGSRRISSLLMDLSHYHTNESLCSVRKKQPKEGKNILTILPAALFSFLLATVFAGTSTKTQLYCCIIAFIKR
jgi:hypothetical protein